jgi:peptidase C25-like protein/Big-like domain-containing protein
MKKYSIVVLSLIVLSSVFSSVPSKQLNDTIHNDNDLMHTRVASSLVIAPINARITNGTNSNVIPTILSKNNESYNYVIITNENLEDAIKASTFLSWKASLGFHVKIMKTTDPLIQDQHGADLPAKIRNFLRAYYQMWGIQFVLLVGSHETIPMRYCYPDPLNHQFNIYDWSNGGEVPTDYYYADLSSDDTESWDSDRDGYYGEFTEDDPDFTAEVYVGRIPTSDSAEITYTLNKIVSYEQDTSDWKKNALHAGSMLFYKNENYQYDIDHDIDGATCLNAIEQDLMHDWTVHHFSEQEGLSPSKYDWDSLTEPAFTKAWRDGKYAVVNWAGHGSATAVGRTIWDWDNGNGIPEHAGNEIIGKPQINIYSKLEDDYPSIVFAVSCLVGYPEPTGYGNLGMDMLIKESFGAAVAVCSASRPAAITVNFTKYHAGAEALCYEFNHYLIDGPEGYEPVGKAFYESKSFVHYNYGWVNWYYEYKNLYNYNLYGDPSMRREGISNEDPAITIQSPEKGIYVQGKKIMPFISTIVLGDILITTNTSNQITKVEFYLDDELVKSDPDEPFEMMWDESSFSKHTVRVVAYDMFDRIAQDESVMWKIF